MINLFEYQNKQTFQGDFYGLEQFLDEIWKRRETSSYFHAESDEKDDVQRFLQFIHKTKELKSNKYVGVIHYNGQRINLFPKIFYNSKKTFEEAESIAIQQHMLWYFSYCRKFKLPNLNSSLTTQKGDFLEVLIYLFAKYTRELLTSSIYQQYEEIENEVHNIRGRLNTPAYINKNLSQGRWHKLNCTYDIFVIDNKFNRIIKHVCRLLSGTSQNSENKKFLREILFILDDVSDVKVSANDCKGIVFNPIFQEFITVNDYCYLFLSNSISIDYKNDLKLFAFLLPMEYVFEDFIFGFINKELEMLNVKPQSSKYYLDESNVFGLKPDLLISSEQTRFIADTKYKIVYSNKVDPKNGISQSDLYQIVSYAIRFSIQDIKLLYPNSFKSRDVHSDEFLIKDKLALGKEIRVATHQLPVINFGLFEDGNDMTKKNIANVFSFLRDELSEKLISIFNPVSTDDI